MVLCENYSCGTVSCETPIQWEQFSLTNICSIWYFMQFVPIAIFLSLHGSAVTCILDASASPIIIHVPPIYVLKHSRAHYTYTRM